MPYLSTRSHHKARYLVTHVIGTFSSFSGSLSTSKLLVARNTRDGHVDSEVYWARFHESGHGDKPADAIVFVSLARGHLPSTLYWGRECVRDEEKKRPDYKHCAHGAGELSCDY
ncbi:hypothetical protein BD309DRAFT_968482, partial [Dichomitus squalens]